MPDVTDVLKAMQTLIDRIADDNKTHGGLVTRMTIRACDEARLVMSRYKDQQHADQQSETATGRVQPESGTVETED